jgi:hypothetical protein
MNKTWLDSLQTALDKAKEELDKASYLEEQGSNPGIRKMNANKADWLNRVVYLAELGLECEKCLSEVPEIDAVNNENISDFQKAMELFRSINN